MIKSSKRRTSRGSMRATMVSSTTMRTLLPIEDDDDMDCNMNENENGEDAKDNGDVDSNPKKNKNKDNIEEHDRMHSDPNDHGNEDDVEGDEDMEVISRKFLILNIDGSVIDHDAHRSHSRVDVHGGSDVHEHGMNEASSIGLNPIESEPEQQHIKLLSVRVDMEHIHGFGS